MPANIQVILRFFAVLIPLAALPAGAASPPPAPVWKQVPEDRSVWRREPFRKLIDPKTAPVTVKTGAKPGGPGLGLPDRREPVLQGIMQSNDRYYAIINGRTVKPGDRIDGWTVSGITRYRVTMKHEQDKQTVDIYEGTIDRGTR